MYFFPLPHGQASLRPTRVAVRVNHGIVADGVSIYANRAVLMATIVWGKIRAQEDYEDTERVAAFDRDHPERATRGTN